MPNLLQPDHSLITIEFDHRPDPDAYAAIVFACWAALVVGGHSQHAAIRPDHTATDHNSKTSSRT